MTENGYRPWPSGPCAEPAPDRWPDVRAPIRADARARIRDNNMNVLREINADAAKRLATEKHTR